jgi:hypothetical protein
MGMEEHMSAYCSNDIPVSDIEFGFAADEEPLPLQVNIALTAIRQIQEHNFSPEAAKALIASIASRVSHSSFSHVQCARFDAIAAVEFLDDAQQCLEKA